MTGNYIPPSVPLYLTPDNIPVGRFCRTISIPDSVEWIGLVDGVLSVLNDPAVWRKCGALEPEEAAAAWTAMLRDSWEIEGCPLEVRQNPDLPCILESSTDGGTTWTEFANLQLCMPILRNGLQGLEVGDGIDFFRVPDGAWVDDPPTNWFADAVPTGAMVTNTNDQCTAAANVAWTLFKLGQGIGESLVANIDIGTTVQYSSLLDEAVGVILGEVGVPALLLLAGAFILEQYLYSQVQWTADAFRRLVCVVNQFITGTPGNWSVDGAGIIANMVAQGVPLDVAGAVGDEIGFIHDNGLNLAAKTTAYTDYDCGATTMDIPMAPSRTSGVIPAGNAGVVVQYNTAMPTNTIGLVRVRWIDVQPADGSQHWTRPTTAASGLFYNVSPGVSGTIPATLPDEWCYNTTVFGTGSPGAAAALAAIRVVVGNPAYNPTQLIAYTQTQTNNRIPQFGTGVDGTITFNYAYTIEMTPYVHKSYGACP